MSELYNAAEQRVLGVIFVGLTKFMSRIVGTGG